MGTLRLQKIEYKVFMIKIYNPNTKRVLAKLFLGDCLEVMQKIPDASVDLVLTDPPYGTTACKWDSVIDLELMWEQLKRITKPNGAIILTASQPFTSSLIASNYEMFKHEIIWFKNVPTGMAQAKYAPMKYHESVIVFCKNKIGTFNKQMQEREGVGKNCYNYEHYCGDSNHVKMKKVKKFYDAKLVNPSSVVLITSVPNRSGKLHPTQKPVALMEYLIKTYSNEKEVVLDFTMGSCTTGVACLNTKRKFIGIESSKDFFAVGLTRVKEHMQEKNINGKIMARTCV